MKKCFIALFLMFFWLAPKASAAWTPDDLTIIGLKMTGAESAVIENTSQNPVSLQNYLVEYFNKSNPASLATPTSVQQLPGFSLGPQQSILLNSDSSLICGAAAVANLSFSMSDSGGYLAIMKVDTQADGSLVYRQQDHVSWTSASTGGDLLKVPSGTADPAAIWYRQLTVGAWRQAELDGCSVLLALTAPSDEPPFVQWANGQEPPATFVPTGNDSGNASLVPAGDLGLAAPIITELLPNPAEPQTDSEDEFIELYNSNDSAFDVTGFKLEIGTSTKHFYTFPPGTSVPAKSFTAFFSVDTGLSLSNGGGQAWLLDPLGTVISQTGAYGAAKDGQAWALANGGWLWTTNPTPNSSNVIAESLSTSSLSLGGSSSKSSKAKTTKAKTAKTSTKKIKAADTNAVQTAAATATSSAPIHPAVLAGIGAAALLYGLYEYRHDLANRFYRFRANRAAGTSAGKKP